jgi:hypothetical protein
MYRPIAIDRENLTIMNVRFPDREKLERAANSLGSNMFEGFVPTRKLVQFYLDWTTGKIDEKDFLARLKESL